MNEIDTNGELVTVSSFALPVSEPTSPATTAESGANQEPNAETPVDQRDDQVKCSGRQNNDLHHGAQSGGATICITTNTDHPGPPAKGDWEEQLLEQVGAETMGKLAEIDAVARKVCCGTLSTVESVTAPVLHSSSVTKPAIGESLEEQAESRQSTERRVGEESGREESATAATAMSANRATSDAICVDDNGKRGIMGGHGVTTRGHAAMDTLSATAGEVSSAKERRTPTDRIKSKGRGDAATGTGNDPRNAAAAAEGAVVIHAVRISGEGEDKASRARLHRAVQETFPFIKVRNVTVRCERVWSCVWAL